MSVLSLIPEEKTKCYQGISSNKHESAESVYSSNSRVHLLHKKKGMGSSAMLASNHSLGSSKGERSVTQRVLSAKMHRVRQLQNQLADAHYHLSELSSENKVLRAMQKKQEVALQKYEDCNAELPKVLNAHSEEVRAQQARYKQLRQQHRDATAKLKEREMELQQLRDEHRHLLELSKDRFVNTLYLGVLASRRYEDYNAELLRMLNAHSEEVRAQQARYKQLRQQHRDAIAKLKEREMELQQLRDEHRHLLELSKDRFVNTLYLGVLASRRYEDYNAELPKMLNAHSEDVRAQQTHFKQLWQQHHDATAKLKEREMELQQLRDEHRHLLEMSKDRFVNTLYLGVLASRRYEDYNAELPKMPNAHSEEVRAQQAAYKQLRQQHRDATAKLKEREMELQQLRDEHHHLLELSKNRNLLEREKLQALVTELTDRVAKQNETISNLQRRITLEAKNFRHQLQQEVLKHKDTRNDLDLAITNADKLSSIIEMKERVINNVHGKRPSNSKSMSNIPATTSRNTSRTPIRTIIADAQKREDLVNGSSSSSDNDHLSKLCENSRYISSALSQDENLTSDEPRTRSALTNRSISSKSVTPTHTRKYSKQSDEAILDIAKAVKDGMDDMSIFREEMHFDSSRDDMENKITSMKSDLLNRIKNEEMPSKNTSAGKNPLNGMSIEEHSDLISDRSRVSSHSRRSSGSVVLRGPVSNEEIIYSDMKRFQEQNHLGEPWAPSESVPIDKKIKTGKSLDTYCKGIMQDIEKSSKVIDEHMKEYSSSRFDSDKLVEQLQSLDKMNEIVKGENLSSIPADALEELNNNFKVLGSQDTKPVPRKRSISGNKGGTQRSANAFGDASMSNQDLLNDLLGTK